MLPRKMSIKNNVIHLCRKKSAKFNFTMYTKKKCDLKGSNRSYNIVIRKDSKLIVELNIFENYK